MASIRSIHVQRGPHLASDIGRGPLQLALDADGEPVLWHAERLDVADFAPSVGTYRFLQIVGDTLRRLPLPKLRLAFPLLRSFQDGRWLVASQRNRAGDQPNVLVFSGAGRLKPAFNAGAGITDVQLTRSGVIWVSYSDQGQHDDLRAFTAAGALLFPTPDFAQQSTLPRKGACDAFNVTSEQETWFTWRHRTPRLVRLDERGAAGQWDSSAVAGSQAFAIHGRQALFAGSFADEAHLHLFDLQTEACEPLRPAYDNGTPVAFERWTSLGRGTRLYLRHGDDISVVDFMRLNDTWP